MKVLYSQTVAPLTISIGKKDIKHIPTPESASAAAVLSGTDLECGSSYKALVESAKKGLISEKDIDVS